MSDKIKNFLEGHKAVDVVLYAISHKLPGIKAFEPSTYQNQALDTMLICAVMELDTNGHELSHEHIMAACFFCFPDKFSFQGMDFFADSLRMEKSLQRCTKKGFVIGKNSQNYILTDKGRRHAKQMFEKYKDGTTKPKSPPLRMRRMEGLIKETMQTEAYQKYIAGKFTAVSESDMCYVLQGTLSTPKEYLRLNLDSLKEVAVELNQTDVIKFFTWLEKNFQHYIK